MSRLAVRTPTVLTYHPDGEQRAELFREAITMVLYVSVVEIAELAALPEGHFAHGRVTGAVGVQLLEIVWGTAVGLALAHWFAFRVAGRAFRGEAPTKQDTWIGFAQVGGAVFVAAVSSVPILLLSNVRAQEFTGDVPALIIGAVTFAFARRSGKSHLTATFYALTALALGVLVAAVKSVLAAH